MLLLLQVKKRGKEEQDEKEREGKGRKERETRKAVEEKASQLGWGDLANTRQNSDTGCFLIGGEKTSFGINLPRYTLTGSISRGAPGLPPSQFKKMTTIINNTNPSIMA